jgi:hypothetical protein
MPYEPIGAGRYVLYTLCPIPSVFLYMAMHRPNGYIECGQVMLNGSLLAFATSLLLTLSGVIGMGALASGRSKIGLLIPTFISALPVIILVGGYLWSEFKHN